MSATPAILSSVVLAILAKTAFSAESAAYVPGELLVRFAPKQNGQRPTLVEQNTILAAVGGGAVERTFRIVPGLALVKLPPEWSVEEALPLFEAAGGILICRAQL
jgi:hypothetical protein